MAARWDIAAVIVALMAMLVTVSPSTVSLLEKALRRLEYLIWPARGRCRRFLWSGVQDGLLHLCDPRGCSHTSDRTSRPHDVESCWDQTLGQVFNRAWYFINADSNAGKYVTKKPYELALNEEYIQTDIQTLKAFLLLITHICRTYETVEVATSLAIQRSRGLITVHLPALGPEAFNTQLTKFEIDRMIEGYPPFYRQQFTTTGGHVLPSPITRSDHIQRGAWILSVGMTTTNGPTPGLYNMQRISHEKPDVYWRGTHVLTAFNMIGRTLAQLSEYENRQGRHPRSNSSQHPWSQDALACFHKIMKPEYSSQPWAIKKEQIESSELFKSIMGTCPCYHQCIAESGHSA